MNNVVLLLTLIVGFRLMAYAILWYKGRRNAHNMPKLFILNKK